jgi:ketosteroid isomerase-like protein
MKNYLSLQMRVIRSLRAPRWIPGSVCFSHVGCAVAPQRSFGDFREGRSGLASGKGRHGGDAIASTRDACASRGSTGLAIFRWVLILFASIAGSPISAAPGAKEQVPSDAVSEIRSVIRMQQDAWNHGDIDRFMNGYAHSRHTVFVSEDTVRRGWETMRDRYREKYSDRAKMRFLTFSDLEFRPLSPNSAVALGRWELQRAKDRPHGRFTLIFRRLPEGWRIVHDHTSAAPPQ